MKRTAEISSTLKKLHRLFNHELLLRLEGQGFTDLRASFLEILVFIAESEGQNIKLIGESCGLKKQTMTSHLNELEKRGYVERKVNPLDKREQNVFLTDFGQKFKLVLMESMNEIDQFYHRHLGEIELERVQVTLSNFLDRVKKSHQTS